MTRFRFFKNNKLSSKKTTQKDFRFLAVFVMKNMTKISYPKIFKMILGSHYFVSRIVRSTHKFQSSSLFIVCFYKCYILQVSGTASEAQLLESLSRYIGRSHYMQKALYHMFRFTQTYANVRGDIIKVSHSNPGRRIVRIWNRPQNFFEIFDPPYY